MRKASKWAGYIFLPIAIIFFIVLLNWEAISYLTIRKVVQFYAGRADIALEVGRISGRPFSETTFENLSIRPADGQPQIYHFKAQFIACTYNIRDLKKGYESFLQGLMCRADNPVFSYDFRAAQWDDQAGGEAAPFFIPATLPLLELQNGSVILSDSAWSAEISNLTGKLSSAPAGHELQLEVGTFKFFQDDLTKIDTGFSTLLLYSDERLTIDSFVVGAEEISATGSIDLPRVDKDYISLGADLSFAGNLLNVSGRLDKQFLKLHAATGNFDIGELQKRLGGAGWDFSGKIKGAADLTVNLKSEYDIEGAVTFGVQNGQVHGVGIDTLSLTGRFDDKSIAISSAEAGTPGNHVVVSDLSVPTELLLGGDILAIIGGTRAAFKADLKDVQTLLQLFKAEDKVIPRVRPDLLTLSGYFENGALYLDDARALKADSSLVVDRAVIPIPATKQAFELVRIDLGARFQSSNLLEIAGLSGDIPVSGQISADMGITGSMKDIKASVSLSGEDLSIKDLQIGPLAMQAEVQLVQEKPGTIKSIHFDIIEMTQTNASGTLAMVSPATGGWQDDSFSMHANLQVDGKGDISIGINRLPEKDITLEIATGNLDSDGWLGIFIDNRYFFHGADTESVVRGLPGNPQVQLTGSIARAGGTGVPFPMAGSFGLHYSSKGIEISEFTWKSHERNQLIVTGYLPYDPLAPKPFLDEEMALNGHIDFSALEDIGWLLEPWGIGKGSAVLDMEIAGPWNQPLGRIQFEAEGIELSETLKKYMDSPLNIRGDISAQGDTIVLQSANFETAAYEVQATGSWQHGLSVNELLKKDKVALKGDVTGDATVQLKDLNFLRKNLPWLRRLEGDMQGELHVSGPVADPAITGSFSFRDGEISHSFNFPMLSAVNLLGDFDKNSITIKNMQSEVGGSPVNLRGRVSKEKDAVDVNLHIDGKNVLLLRNNDMRVRGDVQLDVAGPLKRLVIKGTTGLTGGYYTKNFDFLSMVGSSSAPVSEGVSFLFSFPDPPLRDAVFDIEITTIEPFKIRNNLVRGVLRPELTLKGTGELPFLIGTVYIDPSRILLPSGRLQVQSGLLRFLEEEPDRPQLVLLAQSKVLGYDINVVTRGPLDDPEISLSSSPALPNDDLLLLLLTGQPPKQDVAGGAKGSGTTNVMVYLGKDFLNKWLEDESSASDESILDRFMLDFGRGVTKSGDQTVEAAFRLSEQESGKRKVYYLSGEKDRYDAYNYGLKLVFRFE